MKVTLSDSALQDLEDIVAYYREQGVPEVGKETVSEILDQASTLQEYPDLGRVVPEFETASLRELIRPPYRIVYRRRSELVQIVRVWRSERLLRLP